MLGLLTKSMDFYHFPEFPELSSFKKKKAKTKTEGKQKAVTQLSTKCLCCCSVSVPNSFFLALESQKCCLVIRKN